MFHIIFAFLVLFAFLWTLIGPFLPLSIERKMANSFVGKKLVPAIGYMFLAYAIVMCFKLYFIPFLKSFLYY